MVALEQAGSRVMGAEGSRVVGAEGEGSSVVVAKGLQFK